MKGVKDRRHRARSIDLLSIISMEQQILSTLQRIESEHDVRILFAVESGSRAWGFASTDSDYDIRFVYRRSVRDYMRVSPPREVIEEPIVDNLDVNGWDLLKAVRLFRKSNPTLMEWLFSPVVYREQGACVGPLRRWVRSHYSLHRLAHHYLNMAKGNYRSHLRGKSQVRLKKYLYVLRPLLCIRWMEQRWAPPPTSIWAILEETELPVAVQTALVELLHQKMNAAELETGAPHPVLHEFIQSELNRIPGIIPRLPRQTPPETSLDELVWTELGI
ncbi:hypothetical protein GCM10007416_17020 [Kroppenstedtia guangzhouensis]|uniref:Nucleotidyltransferase n=1 Tax=Kroppenstedtia guangzhouensis TaxID=1274356 RepID=A0ABQ1GJ63_9BACL|nr:hypothetical protein GCM10007416_17020 [Kroppenstedtia guangzhouensis]